MTIQELLTKFNISQRAARVYVVMLKTDQVRIRDIVQELGEARQLIYEAMAELEGKGLVVRIPISKHRYSYQASSPEVLVEIAMQRVNETQSMLPKLLEIYNSNQKKGSVSIYTGKMSIRAYWKGFVIKKMNRNTPQLTLGAMEQWYGVGGKTAEVLPRLKFKKSITTKILATDGEFAQRLSRQPNYETRILENTSLTGEITIYGDIVHFINYTKGNINMTVIESEVISKTMKEMFYMLWEGSKTKDTI